MRGTGGGADGRGAGGGALADAAGVNAAGETWAGGVAGRIGGAITGDDATDDAVTDDDAAGGATAGRPGVTGTGGDVIAGVVAGFAAGGATVVGRLTAAGGAVTGFSAGGAGGAAGRDAMGGATASFRCVIAFNTSPGREMCDRSILVLISSSPRAVRELDLPAEDEPSAEERIYTLTFSASCSSRELECVFFSVTPTAASASRMALLLTSSSRARSLIRTLLIRPFVSPCCS